MGRFRALLVGVAEYDDPDIKDLPFVADDLVNVAVALETREYTVEIAGEGGRLGQTRIRTEVSRFLVTANPGDTLLIYLSGHGAHANNIDYLLPSDADLKWLSLAEVAVPLTAWGTMIDQSSAAGILFVVDACREGFHENTKSAFTRTAWAQDKIAKAARRNVAWLFPCSPGEVARYVPSQSGGGSFSLFARAVELAISEGVAPTTLSGLKSQVAAKLSALAMERRLPDQQVRLAGEVDHDAFVVLPGRSSVIGDGDDWAEAAATHIAWKKTHKGSGSAELREDVISVVRRLAAHRWTAAGRLAEDPWHDSRFALRMSERMNFILGSLLDGLSLSPAEAALLVTAPFVHDTHWAHIVAHASAVSPTDLSPVNAPNPQRKAYEVYARSYPRLLRRAVDAAGRGDTAVPKEIGWWLLHRWITRQATSFGSQAVAVSLDGHTPESGLLSEVLTTARLSELIRLLYADPGFIARTDRPHGLMATHLIAPGRIGEQAIRERLVAYLVVVAHRMAIEVTRLGGVLVDHIGIVRSLAPQDVLQTIDQARWEPRGAGRVLRAACSHPAVEVALREHVTDLNQILADIGNTDDPSLAELVGLPGRADADQVRAAESDGVATYTSAGIRFRLDEERVQELLMGERLYSERDLALREVYQNALDACRYRKARTEYLRRTGVKLPEWEGRIGFSQGIDEQGRPYIDCVDNGIGMGVRELRDVFAQAGVRFAELPEFIEEQAEWDKLEPPVLLYPNSQFGIGVLSYFMLADEITVTTCRLGRDGRPGRRLQVSIAGPGTLFHIQDCGPGQDAGTVVRLHLRTTGDAESVSCTATLTRILSYSEFSVEAADGDDRIQWNPMELRVDGELVSDKHSRGPVWWREGLEYILADGLRTDTTSFGMVVNLSGEHSPELTIDRASMLDSARNAEVMVRVLSRAVKQFAGNSTPIRPTFDWLSELIHAHPVIADLVFSEMVSTGKSIELNGHEINFGRLGFFSMDRDLIPSAISYRQPDYVADSVARRREYEGIRPLPDDLVIWRLAALRAAEGGPCSTDAPAARPTDVIVLSGRPDALYSRLEESWLTREGPVPRLHFVRAALETGYGIGEIAQRLNDLGYEVPSELRTIGSAEESDLVLLSKDLHRYGTSLDVDLIPDTPPAALAGHIATAAIQLGRPIKQVIDRLSEFGFLVPAGIDVQRAEPSDRILLSRDLNGAGPWLRLSDSPKNQEPISVGHVVAVAAQLGRDVDAVAERLRDFSFTVPHELPIRGRLSSDDLVLMSRNFDGRPPMLPGIPVVPIGHLLMAAKKTSKPIGDIAARLARLGFRVPASLAIAREDDLDILDLHFDGTPQWLTITAIVDSRHIVEAAFKLGRGVEEVARRLTELGFDVPQSLLTAGDVREGDDVALGIGDANEETRLSQWVGDDLRPVRIGHLVTVAEKLDRPVGEIAERLTQLGYLVPPPYFSVGRVQPGDRILVSRSLTGGKPWLDGQLVPLGHVFTAAGRLKWTIEKTVTRLAALGLNWPALPETPIDATDLILMSRELSDFSATKTLSSFRYGNWSWWLDQEKPVPLWNIFAGAVQTNLPVHAVVERFRSLGFILPEIPTVPELLNRAENP
uniref:wHTH domain-containing protein n=1 Tax=Herbidospora sakaeratensis TaxID=564415 RepID=UPI0009FD8675|nr:caspase family protein [Herbidospora sakaeratensis]